MPYQYPPSLNRLINQLAALPGLGAEAAQRLAFHLLKVERENALGLAQAIEEARARIRPCPVCGNFTDQRLCPVCSDASRDQSLLCVVESVADIIAMERSGNYRGLYHVLGGAISPLDGIGPDQLRVASLISRVEQGRIKEIIMATNPNPEGEATAEYLAQKLKRPNLAITRLAHGMPVGGALAFVDEATLELAMAGRKAL